MKKILNKVLTLAVATTVLVCLSACNPDAGTTSGGTGSDIWEGAEIIESLAEKSTSWGDAITVPSSYTKRLQVGSKVIFELAKNGDYLKFHVDDGNWGAVGVEKYYNKKGNEIPVDEDSQNEGVYNTQDGAVDDGVFYFVVKESNLEKLKAGFALQGNLIVKKIGITNLAEEAKNEDIDYDVEYSGDKLTFTANNDDASTESETIILLKYDRTEAGKDEVLTFSDVELEIKVGEETIETDTALEFALDPNTPNEYKVKIKLGKSISKDTVVTVELKSAKIKTAGADVTAETPYKITATLVDIAESAGWWKPLTDESQTFQALIKGDAE